MVTINPRVKSLTKFLLGLLYIMLNDHLKSGKYVGNRPIKLRKSNWKERTDHEALERQKVLFPILHCVVKFSFLLAQCVVRAYVEFIVFLTEPKSKETEAFEEECLAQVRIRLYDANVMMLNSLKSFLCLSPFVN